MSLPLKVALLHQIDPAAGTSSWVITLRFLKAALERHVGEVRDLGPAPINIFPYRAARKLVRAATGRNYSFHHDPTLGRRIARHFDKMLAEGGYDLVFAPAASAFIPFLETSLPIIGYSDATWRLVRDYYSDYSNMLSWNAAWGDELERRMLERVTLMFYQSQWAATSAINDYGADPAAVRVNFMGATLASPPARHTVLPRGIGKSVRLLLVGFSWETKGGDIAYETLLRLLEAGYNAHLTVVGCAPPEEIHHPRLEIVPPLDKQNPDDAARFDALWRGADLFILPSRFEATGGVLCEAGAYALPSLATQTGGIPSMIRDGANGFLLPPGSRGDAYAEIIAGLIASPERYQRLCISSRDEYENRLNWDACGMAMARAIGERLPHLRDKLPIQSSSDQNLQSGVARFSSSD